jgi:hypothetical protein
MARGMALIITRALRAGVVDTLTISERVRSPAEAEIPAAPSAAPACPESPPPLPCPSPVCPPAPPCPSAPEPSRPAWYLVAGGAFSSHPVWNSPGLGFAVEASWSFWSWLEAGVGIGVIRSHRVELDGVNAVYSNWPVSAFLRLHLGGSVLEGLVDVGFGLAATRLDALIVPLEEVRSFSKVNPVILGRAGLRWLFIPQLGVQLTMGTDLYLVRQRYVFGSNGHESTVLSMQIASLEARLLLVVPIR